MQFLNISTESFGLHISDSSLKIVKLERKKKNIQLISFGETPVPEGLIDDGEIRDAKTLAQIIQSARSNIRGKRIRTKYVVCSLPEEKAFLQVISMPKMTAEEIKKSVLFESENYIPLPISEVYLDSQIIVPLADHLDHCDVLLAALPKKIIDPYVSSLKYADLIPTALEIESFALARAIIKNETTHRPVIIIDIGNDKTNFAVFAGTTIRFSCSIPIGGRDFTEKIAQGLKISFEKAEKLKQQFGILGAERVKFSAKKNDGSITFSKETPQEKQIFNTLTPLLQDLLEQIEVYMDYYFEHASHEHLPPAKNKNIKILLSGGGANLKGLDSFFQENTKMETSLANPWINILPAVVKHPLQIPPEESLEYRTAIGLAMRGLAQKTDD